MYYPPVENNIWRQIVSLLEKISGEKIVYGLLFLLPIFAVTVRHWVSSIFGVLALLSLVLLYLQRKQRTELFREEKILLWGFAIYFGVFLFTSVINGWGPAQTRSTGVEIRFLMFVPIYLVIRQMGDSAKWLIIGSVLGVVFTAYDGARVIFLDNIDVYRGMYSPLFTGPIILLLAAILFPYFYAKANNKWQKLFLLLVVCLAFFVVSQTGARNAYVAAIFLSLLFVFHQYQAVKRYVLIGAALSLACIAYISVDTINGRVDRAYDEYTEYFAYKNPARTKKKLSSVGVRLEMWRATPMFFKENPFFGIGRGNYSTDIKHFVEKRWVHEDIGKHGHPHNVYSEAIISKGLFGLVVFLWISIYPLVILIKGYRNSFKSAYYGITLIAAYLIFSLTDASTLIKGNYSSMYIVFLAVLFSYHIQEKQQIALK